MANCQGEPSGGFQAAGSRPCCRQGDTRPATVTTVSYRKAYLYFQGRPYTSDSGFYSGSQDNASYSGSQDNASYSGFYSGSQSYSGS